MPSRIARSSPSRDGEGFFVSSTMIEAPMAARRFAITDFSDALGDSTPLGEIGSLDKIVAAVLWFASDASKFVTAQNINIDGSLRRRRVGR